MDQDSGPFHPVATLDAILFLATWSSTGRAIAETNNRSFTEIPIQGSSMQCLRPRTFDRADRADRANTDRLLLENPDGSGRHGQASSAEASEVQLFLKVTKPKTTFFSKI